VISGSRTFGSPGGRRASRTASRPAVGETVEEFQSRPFDPPGELPSRRSSDHTTVLGRCPVPGRGGGPGSNVRRKRPPPELDPTREDVPFRVYERPVPVVGRTSLCEAPDRPVESLLLGSGERPRERHGRGIARGCRGNGHAAAGSRSERSPVLRPTRQRSTRQRLRSREEPRGSLHQRLSVDG